MQDSMIIIILTILLAVGVVYTIRHFKGKSACCGGGSTYVSKKRLDHVAAKKTFLVEGMTCENCKARVERYVNELDGAAGKVNLKKNELVVSMEYDISDEKIIQAVEKAGYHVLR